MTECTHDMRSRRVPSWAAAVCHPAVMRVQAYFYPGPQPPIYGGPGLAGGLVNGVLQGMEGLLGGAPYSYGSYPAGYGYAPPSYAYPPGEPRDRTMRQASAMLSSAISMHVKAEGVAGMDTAALVSGRSAHQAALSMMPYSETI